MADAIVVGPDDFLVLRVPDDLVADQETLEGFTQTLKDLGLGERVLIVAGALEMAKVEAE